MRKRTIFLILFFSVFLGSPDSIFAAGFFIREQSASGLGTSFAGSHTGANDLSDMFFNPAAIFQSDSREALLAYSSLSITSTYNHESATNFLGAAIPGAPGGANIAPRAGIPSFYAASRHGTRQTFGIAVNAPWGLESSQPDGWVGRYHALHSKMKTLNLTPVWGFKMGDRTSGAIGWQRQQIDASMNNAIDFGAIGAAAKIPGAVPGKMDGLASMGGDSWGNGFILGFLHELDDSNKIGLSYRSKIRHTLRGTAEFALDPAGIGKALSAATKGFQNTGDEADLNTPSVFGFGYQHVFDKRWKGFLDITKTGWSDFQELRIRFDNPAQADSVTNEKWHDTWFYSLGFHYKPQNRLTWKFGVALDKGPVDDEYRIPRIPSAESRWLSLGLTWEASKDTWLDLSFAHLDYAKAPIRLSSKDTGSTFRGNLNGSFDTRINIIGFSLNARF